MPGWIEVFLQSAAVLLLGLVGVRIAGKRNISRSTPFQYIALTAIGVTVALVAAGVISFFVPGLVVLVVLVALPLFLDYLAMRSKAVHDFLNGRETVLVKQGKVMEENLKQVRLTGEELLREARAKDAFNLGDVEFAVMESNGEISVLLKSDRKPLSSRDLGKKVLPQGEPQAVILDGHILHDPLTEAGLDQHWLKEQLENNGVDLANVFLGQVDSSGELYLDLFDDSLRLARPAAREMLYANLEKSQADLMKYALETDDPGAGNMYSDNAEKLKSLMEKLEPYLLR